MRLGSPSADTQWVRTSVLREYCDPFDGCWGDLKTPLTLADVDEAYAALPAALAFPHKRSGTVRQHHARRVAWLARHGFSTPLEVDVGVPALGCHVDWMVEDGNHRLAAGVWRLERMGEDALLPLEVSGSVDYARELGLLASCRIEDLR